MLRYIMHLFSIKYCEFTIVKDRSQNNVCLTSCTVFYIVLFHFYAFVLPAKVFESLILQISER